MYVCMYVTYKVTSLLGVLSSLVVRDSDWCGRFQD